MLMFYGLAFAAMIIISLLLFKAKGTISALCGIVLLSYLSFFCLYYTPYKDEFYISMDSVRIGFVMISILYCGIKSDKPIVYLVYAITLLVNLMINMLWLFVSGFYIYADSFYIVIAAIELIIFGIGTDRTLKIKSRKRNVSFHLGNLGSINNYWCGLVSGDDTVSKGAKK